MDIRHCLIIEDDPSSIEILQEYLSKIPFINVGNVCVSYFSAIHCLSTQKYDLVFLDLHLSGSTMFGIKILEKVQDLPPVIITTNSPEFAVDSYRIGKSVDYLLKPFDFNRLLVAINRALNLNLTEKQNLSEKHIFLKTGRKFQKFKLDEIDYFEAYGIYLKIFINGVSHVVNETVSGIEEQIQSRQFLRVHKSYVVNINKITGFDHNNLFLKNGKVPIGAFYKPKLECFLSLFSS